MFKLVFYLKILTFVLFKDKTTVTRGLEFNF
jgi:hypothetical protein